MHRHVYVQIHIHMYVFIIFVLCVDACMCICVYLFTYVYAVYKYMNTYVHVYANPPTIYIYIYVHVCVCVSVFRSLCVGALAVVGAWVSRRGLYRISQPGAGLLRIPSSRAKSGLARKLLSGFSRSCCSLLQVIASS